MGVIRVTIWVIGLIKSWACIAYRLGFGLSVEGFGTSRANGGTS